MFESPRRPIATYAPFAVRAASAIAILIGALTLLGWFAGLRWLTDGGLNLATMKANTAVACILAGLALAASSSRSRRTREAGLAAGVVLVSLVLAVLAQYVSRSDLGIDQLLVRDEATAPSSGAPGRMGAATACLFLLVGVEVLLLNARRLSGATQVLGGVVLGLSFIPFLGYLYGANELYSAHPFTTVALPTTLALMALGAGALAAVPEVGLVRLLTGPDIAGTFCRRLVPAALLVPVVLGWIRLQGQRAGLYDTEFGLALFASSNVVVFLALIFWNARWLAWTATALARSERRYRALVQATSQTVWTAGNPDAGHEARSWWTDLTGQTAAESEGWGWLDAVHPDERDRVRAAWASAFATLKFYDIEYRVRIRTGEYRYFAVRGVALTNPDGGLYEWVGTLTDIDDKKRAERELQELNATLEKRIADRTAELNSSELRFRAVVDATQAGLVMVDRQRTIVLANRLTLQLFGWEAHELVGQRLECLIPERYRAAHPDHVATFFAAPSDRLMGSGRNLTGLRKDGMEFPIEVGLLPVEAGEDRYVLASVTDITDRKRIEAALRESELRFEAIFHSQFQFIGLMSLDGKLIEANRTSVEAAGATLADVIDKPFWDTAWWTHDPAQQERLKSAIRLAAAGEKQRFEASHPSAAGGLLWVDFSLTPFRDSRGEVTFLIPEGRDITERKVFEKRIGEQEDRLRVATAAACVGVWEWNILSNQIIWNDQMFRIYGVAPTPDGLVNYDVWSNAVLPEDLPEQERLLQETVARAGGGARAFRIRLPDGECRHIEAAEQVRPNSRGQAEWMVGTNLDVSERKRAEAALRASEERFKSLAGNAPVGIFETDPAGNCLFVNDRWCELTGLAYPEALGSGWMRAIHPDDRERVTAEWYASAREGREFATEYRFLTPVGRVVWVSGRAAGLVDSSGRVSWHIGVVTDITDRKAFEYRLGEQEERFRSAFEFAAIGMAIVGLDGRWLRVNESLCELLGYAKAELLVTDFQTITHPDDLETDLILVRQVLAGERRTYQMEKRYFRKTGETVHVLLAVSLVRDGVGAPLYFISQIENITQRKLAEAKVDNSLKEKEILLREIHHRVKNNLAVIGSLFYLQSTRTHDAETLLMLEECQNRIRAMSLVHESLYQSDDLAAVDFGEYARNLGSHLVSTYLLAPGTVQLHVVSGEVRLDIDRAIPCGLILNELIANALKHAFPNGRGGEIRLTLEKGDGGKLLMSVADDGVGLPEGANTPSTRSLGLRLVHSLSRQLDAHFELIRLETGTEARLTLDVVL